MSLAIGGSISALKGHALWYKLSFRFEPVLDIVAVYSSPSKEQFVCSLRNVIFSYCGVIFCNYRGLTFWNNELEAFGLSLCL